MWNAIHRFFVNEDGPTAVEYAVMLGLILMAVLATVLVMGITTSDSFAESSNAISGALSN